MKESKVCVIRNTEKSIDNIYNKKREGKQCKNKRSLKRYYEHRDKLSNQQKKCYGKSRVVFFAKSKLNQQKNMKVKYINNK